MKTVIGVDAGGSKTRALAVSLDGTIVGYGEGGGGNPSHDANYLENIRGAIASATSNCGPETVVRVVAGIAGFDRESDIEWAAACTAAPGIIGSQVQINDADIAHYGAFQGAPGLVSIQGDGSMIFGVTDTGRRIRNFDYCHYARAAGPWIGSLAILMLLARGPEPDDADFVTEVLRYWEANSFEDLREIASHFRAQRFQELLRKQGDMAPIVTAAAAAGSTAARLACDDAAENVADGIRLLGRMFEGPDVPVALIGSCVRSSYLRCALEARLAAATEKRYRVIDAAYSPVAGAVLMALAQEGIQLDATALCGLRSAT